MKNLGKGTIGLIAVVAVVVLWAISAYNGMVQEQEKATTAFANVQSAYQRRADLIPNLVEVVKGYAKHEEETFKGVVEARAKATQVTIDPSNVTPEQLKEFQAAQGELSSALSRLLAVQENYPELKANENYAKTMDSVNLYENQVRMSRMVYNDTVTVFNREVRQFPTNLIAKMLGFVEKDYLKVEAAKTDMPSMKI